MWGTLRARFVLRLLTANECGFGWSFCLVQTSCFWKARKREQSQFSSSNTLCFDFDLSTCNVESQLGNPSSSGGADLCEVTWPLFCGEPMDLNFEPFYLSDLAMKSRGSSDPKQDPSLLGD